MHPQIIFYLLGAHALCDYPLQGDFLARGKNHKNPLPGVPWYQCLLAHALIHGFAVSLITGSLWLGLAETICHTYIDYSKCNGKFASWGGDEGAFNFDQYLHAMCKVAWYLILTVNHL